ncbi:MAG: hypothetical protein WAO29_04615 [Candidatus Nanopelagicales bacterium]
MIVTSLEKMEAIVEKNWFLYWDGWTVVQSFPSDKGRTSKFGAYRNKRWHLQRRYEPTERGWNIPKKLAGSIE